MRPDAYMLPKVESAKQVQHVSDALITLERQHGIPPHTIELIPIIETALGVINLHDIVHSGQRITALAFGAEDLTSSIGATRTHAGHEVLYARSAVVLYAKALGLQAIDTPYIALRDLDGLREAAQTSRTLGFDGRLCIHPAQVEVVVAAFTPTPEEVAQARALISAYEAHQREGTGVFVHEGRMVDTPMLRAAHNTLARAGEVSS
jgi:citrate lyase beta subunit